MRRGFVTSRAQASALIGGGQVLVAGAIADKPSRLVAPGEPIELRERPRYVSRGGVKLEAALEAFDLDVSGRHCLDAGASTGGFTDCLLQHGARSVVAVDVGRGQLDAGLRSDPRVRSMEGVNVRNLTAELIGGAVEFVAADLSFISLRLVAPALASAAQPAAHGVLLVKPQFEAGRSRVGRGGIVREPSVHRDVLGSTVTDLASGGWGARGVIPSPVRGSSGNVEFLVHVVSGAMCAVTDADLDGAVEAAHEGTSR